MMLLWMMYAWAIFHLIVLVWCGLDSVFNNDDGGDGLVKN